MSIQNVLPATSTSNSPGNDYVIPAGATVNVVVYAASGSVPAGTIVDLSIATTGAPTPLKRLSGGTWTTSVTGPGTLKSLLVVAGVGVAVGIDVNY